jgi:hypothetical protein
MFRRVCVTEFFLERWRKKYLADDTPAVRSMGVHQPLLLTMLLLLLLSLLAMKICREMKCGYNIIREKKK